MAGLDIDKLDMRDNVLFGTVFERNREACRRSLETMLGLTISEIVDIRRELVVDPGVLSRGVRLDVRVKDGEGRAFDVEMQKASEVSSAETPRWVLRRARYYQSTCDVDTLGKGSSVSELPELHIVFICDFDPLGGDLRRYTVERTRVEDGLPASNGVHEVYLRCTGGKGDVGHELDALLRFIGGDGNDETDLVRDLQATVDEVKADEVWRAERMTFQDMLDSERRRGLQQGLEQGLQQGLEQGLQQGLEQGLEQGRKEERQRLAELSRRLADAGRADELASALADPVALSELLADLGVSE